MNKFAPAVSILTTITVIAFLLLGSVRFLLTPLFLEIEYRMPEFPADQYGFSFEERMKWARISLDYLLNDEGIEYLEQQKLSEGQPLYNERELSHMQDVKLLVRRAIITWYSTIALLILFGLFANQFDLSFPFWKAFARGGLWTVCLIVLIILGVLLSFSALFTAFHGIFFEGDTWLFSYSDSLIRLFPMRFWQDAFIIMGVLSVIGGLAAFIIGRKQMEKASDTTGQ